MHVDTKPILMDGAVLAKKILDRCAGRVERIKAKTGVTPALATVLVGLDPASVTYVAMKVRRCEAVGMKSIRVDMSDQTTTAQLVAKITQLSDDPAVHGILLQHPVPGQIDERAGFEAIKPIKDVDGVTMFSFGAISFDLPGVPGKGYGSCTPAGMMRLLEEYDVQLSGKHAVVVGRSPILGKPMAMMLLAKHATVTVCHSRTQNLPELVKQGDIVVAAVGKPAFVKGEWIKDGAVVLDAGYHPNDGKIGDVEFTEAAKHASMITPVPGSVGPMTIATLIDQTSIGSALQLGVDVN